MSALGKSSQAYRFDVMKLPFKFAMAVLFIASAFLVGAQSLQTIYFFPNNLGLSGLTLGTDGNFYGTTEAGGGFDYGTIFRMTSNGTVSTLVSFSGTNGRYPSALALGSDGKFYGTTEFGGTTLGVFDSWGAGTIFQLTTNGTFTSLVSFNYTNGENPNPYTALILGNDGSFYGTTYAGGGTLFQVTTNGILTSLCSFTNQFNPHSLAFGNDGNFYGTTTYGGITNATYTYGMGTVFQLTTNGRLTTLVMFNGTNGVHPSGLMLADDGNFYGTTDGTTDPATGGYGSIFKVTTNGTLTTLLTFSGIWPSPANPAVALTLGNDGNFYGTTVGGGYWAGGTIFQVTPNGALTTLASFYSFGGDNYPLALTLGNDGNFYGLTYESGAGYWSVFRLLMTPTFSLQPQSLTNNAGGTVTFTCGTILQQVAFQWQENGTNLTDGGNISGATTSALSITSISNADAAIYSVLVSNAEGSVLSSNATLTVIDPPSITAQPTNLLVLAGSNVAFGVILSGTAPFNYQWLFNSTNLLSGWTSTYTILSVGTNNAGNYSVLVSNAAGSITSSVAALTVVLSPTSQTRYASSTATFKVTAITPEPLSYQWQKNGVNLTNGGNISGATNSTLTIASISDADAANYSAVVDDAYSGVTTSAAELTVNDSLFFVAQPLSQMVRAGIMVTFTATAYGAPPFVFQWSFNRTPVSSTSTGANFSSLTLTNVGTDQAGNYTVEVFNGTGNLTSSNAVLTVIQPPTLALQILAGYPLVSLYGTLGNNFVVQYNTNLANTNWQTLLSLTNLTSSPFPFLDPSGVGQPERFYRAFFTQ
jgi:uncharacterized repeat protein (TIGR03803 family)